jgi:two-component system response regulator
MVRDETILLIEDNPDDELLTRRTLKKSNVCNRVVVARDGAEALDYLFFGTGTHEGRDLGAMPQVILLDLDLPKIDGLEVLKRIRSDERTRRLPTVIFTSSEDQEDLVDGYGLGANSYVRKPLDLAQFRAAVQQLELYWVVLNEVPQG